MRRSFIFKRCFALLNMTLLFALPLCALEFEAALYPQVDFHLDDDFDNSFSGKVSLEFFPFTVRTRDKIGFGLEGGIAAIKAATLDTTALYAENVSASYTFRIHDRFSCGAKGFFGIWQFSDMSGLDFGANLFADFHILPELKAGIFAGFSDFYYKPEDFARRVDVGLSVKYNFSKGIFSRRSVAVDELESEPIFPVFYSFYNDNAFGTVTLFNEEENKITDVTVSVIIPEYMQNAKTCATFDVILPNELFEVPLTAFLNETILESLISHNTEGKIIVSYRSLGKKVTSESPVTFTALSRNSMNWDDDRRAAAFVSSHDGAAVKIAKLAKSIIIKNPQNDYTQNLSLARGIFAVLKAYGVSYVKDPTSPFSSETVQDIDFLQFPYQTLLYSGGDCDDLSILNCALFEAVGIKTAFITVPGHILMAIDSGISPDRAVSVLKGGRYIIQDGVVWIPLEATVCQETFEVSRAAGYNQWRISSKSGEAKLYPLADAWTLYKAVIVPESDADIELPSVEKVLRYIH